MKCLVVGVLTAGVLTAAALTAAALTACRASTHQPTPFGPPQSPGRAPGVLSPEVVARAVDFHGTCSWGRAPGDPAVYRVPLRARDLPGGTILVRSTATFIALDDTNVVGELPSGTRVLGDGPVYDSVSGRTGWAILVRGHTGRICRGYVSASSVVAE